MNIFERAYYRKSAKKTGKGFEIEIPDILLVGLNDKAREKRESGGNNENCIF
jgi:hypothetical protein